MYSPDIDKICAVCINAEAAKGVPTHMACRVHGGYVPASKEACESFGYDIFKKKVSRKKSVKKEYNPEDFKL